jgi:hypothetical protein
VALGVFPGTSDQALAAETFTVQSNLLSPSFLTKEDLDRFLGGTPLAGTGHAFLDAEAAFGVNARFLVGLAAVESALGASDLARKDHNLFGIVGSSWSSYEAGIAGGAGFIFRNFLSPRGAMYNGPTLSGMNVKYATSPTWASNVALWVNRIPASAAPEYAAQFDYVWMPRSVEAGAPMPITATLRNLGWHPWSAGGAEAAAVSIRIFDPASGAELFPGGIPRAPLDRMVHNHQSASVAFDMPAPLQGGSYLVRVGALAGNEWMVSLTRPQQERLVAVRPRRAHWQLEN